MEAPYHEGVHYFSRAEEARARLSAAQRQDRANLADIQPRADDVESLELVKRLHKEVIAWKNRTTVRPVKHCGAGRLTTLPSQCLTL